MQKILCMAVVALGLAACGDSKSDKNTSAPVGTNQFKQLRSTIERDLAANNAAAVSIAIYQDGNIVFAEAFGEKVRGGGQAVTPDTLFQMGSTTKVFTGVATMQLVQQGLLGTHDKLVNTLPDIQYPASQALTWQDINIHHLLTHQSGLFDRYIGSDESRQLVEYMTTSYPQQNRQMNPPGRFHNYSNPNWSYLGAIVEDLSNQPFTEYMQQNVFEPLGMQRTSLDRSRVISDGDYALGFQRLDGNDEYLTDINQIPALPSASPAGTETWSTPTELLKVADFLLNGDADVLSNQWRTQITTPHVSTEFAGLPLHYGYGIYVDDGFMYNDQWYAEKVWQHGGNTSAFTHLFWILPEKNIAVSVMSSGGYTNFDASMVAALNSVTELPSPAEIPVAAPNPDEYAKHEGTYDTGQFTVIVEQQNDELHITIPELDAQNVPYEQAMAAIGDTTFFAEVNNELLQITFLPETEGGESVYMRHRNLVGIKDGY